MSADEANKLVDKEADKLNISWIKDSVMLPHQEMASYVAAQLRHHGRLVVRVDTIGTKVVTYDVDVTQKEFIKHGMLMFVRGMSKGREEYKK